MEQLYVMEYKLTSEFRYLLKEVKEWASNYKETEIGVPTFILVAVNYPSCDAYKGIKSLMLSAEFDSLVCDMFVFHGHYLRSMGTPSNDEGSNSVIVFNEKFDAALKECAKKVGQIDSMSFLATVIKTEPEIYEILSKYGITYEQMDGLTPEHKSKNKVDRSVSVKTDYATKQTKNTKHTQTNMTGNHTKSVVETSLTNLNDIASKGKITPVVGNSMVYDKIFTAWARCERNNVVLVGATGVGKTSTVRHIANMLIEGDVPQSIKGRKLMQLRLADLMPSSGIKGIFEEKFKSIVDEATVRDCYIFFIDDIRSALNGDAHYSDMGIEALMDMILSNPNILFICTADESDYSTLIDANPFFRRRMKRVTLEEKNENECIDVIKAVKKKYEDFHNVRFDDDFIKECIRLCKKNIPSCVLPDTVIDVMDDVGAEYSVAGDESDETVQLRAQLSRALSERQNSFDEPSKYTKEQLDEIDNEIVRLGGLCSESEKRGMMSENVADASQNVLRKIVSERSSKNINDVGENERQNLINLHKRLSEYVIGQDEAVDKITRAVKRNRLGLTRPNRPSVFLFVGSTGTGKTYLAKKLAEVVFGSEKSMVRLDMSEYSEKTSVTKLYGSSPGYVGYENGGTLTEAVKKNGHCVVLLDEIEKATEEVHDTLLQIFDDGRMTDNKGVTVSFKNTIVIMTSNAGASEADERGSGTGFVKNETMTDTIMMRAVRHIFKPEFINRIDAIITFSKLGKDELDKITRLEVEKAVGRLSSAGYKTDETFFEQAVSAVRENVDTTKYGARPISVAVDRYVMDPVSDYILEKDVKTGEVIPSSAIYCHGT